MLVCELALFAATIWSDRAPASALAWINLMWAWPKILRSRASLTFPESCWPGSPLLFLQRIRQSPTSE